VQRSSLQLGISAGHVDATVENRQPYSGRDETLDG